ncbi:hypothetical protein MRX96_011531 [Rhipicephalus microplus]
MAASSQTVQRRTFAAEWAGRANHRLSSEAADDGSPLLLDPENRVPSAAHHPPSVVRQRRRRLLRAATVHPGLISSLIYVLTWSPLTSPRRGVAAGCFSLL